MASISGSFINKALFISISSVGAFAGPVAIACGVACNAGFVSCIGGAGAPSGGAMVPICYAGALACYATCTGTCQDGSNVVMSAQGIPVKVRDVQVGDLVETIDEYSGENIVTVVKENSHMFGLFSFIEVALDGDVAFNVTSEHVVVVQRGQKWEIERAQNVRVGDVMLSSSRVPTAVQSTRQYTNSEKWVFGTHHGTALVNGIQMTTFCDDSFDLLPRNYTSAMKTWRRLHAAFGPGSLEAHQMPEESSASEKVV